MFQPYRGVVDGKTKFEGAFRFHGASVASGGGARIQAIGSPVVTVGEA